VSEGTGFLILLVAVCFVSCAVGYTKGRDTVWQENCDAACAPRPAQQNAGKCFCEEAAK
jgi:hypothetical protein